MTSQLSDPNFAPHLEPQKGTTLKGLSATWVTLTGLAILLRFWSRATSSKKKFGADDWTALASWPLVATLNLLAATWTGAGLGRHISEVPLGDILKGLKMLYAGYIVYNLGMTMVRFSAILFYNRIFEPRNTNYRYYIWVALGLNTLWFLAFGTVAIVPCRPIEAFWNKPLLLPSSYKCSSTLGIQLSSGITSVFMDLMVLILPMPRLWRLQTSLRKRLRVLFIFLMGYCVIIFTVGRLVSVARAGKALNEDITWSFVTTLYWFTCEISIASMSISLPVIFQLIVRAIRHGPAALFNDKEYSSNSSKSQQVQKVAGEGGFVRLTNGRMTKKRQDVSSSSTDSAELVPSNAWKAPKDWSEP